MPKYLALFRGINVSGRNLVKMAALRDFFISLNFEEVQSYIQSGNMVFSSAKKDAKKLEIYLENEFYESFGFSVPILILTKKKVKTALAEKPFSKGTEEVQGSIYYIFLKQEPSQERARLFNTNSYEFERFHLYQSHLYLECFKGMGKAKLNTNLVEKKLEVSATARNERTMNKLFALLND